MPLSTYLVSAADTSKVGLVALDWETKCLHFYEINTWQVAREKGITDYDAL